MGYANEMLMRDVWVEWYVNGLDANEMLMRDLWMAVYANELCANEERVNYLLWAGYANEADDVIGRGSVLRLGFTVWK